MLTGMPRAWLLGRWAVLTIGLALALGIGLGLGLALSQVVPGAEAHHDPDVIHACKGDRSGSLRVVANPDACQRGESPISWNAEGPVGPTNVRSVRSAAVLVQGGAFGAVEVYCAPGEYAAGGGWSGTQFFSIVGNIPWPAFPGPETTMYGWQVSVFNNDGAAQYFAAIVSCVSY